MSQHATREICPRCGGPAVVTWLGIAAYGHNSPSRKEAVTLDCPNHCDFTVEELGLHFGTGSAPQEAQPPTGLRPRSPNPLVTRTGA